jgi:hypothetical protein
MQEGSVCGYDFTNPTDVKETTIEQPANLNRVPRSIRDALRGALAKPDPPATPK